MNELLGDVCVERRAEVYEKQSDIAVFLSRCVRAEWRAVEMASSVEKLDRYAHWNGSREEDGRPDVFHD